MELQEFSDWLWNSNPIRNLFVNALELVQGLYISPCTPQNYLGEEEIKLGGIGTGVTASRIGSQFEYIDMGTLNIKEYYGNFLDYQINCSIYLPYIGIQEIDINYIMSGSINLKYMIDYLSGVCIAFITCVRGGFNSVVYQFNGNIYTEIPLMSSNSASLFNSLAETALMPTASNAVNAGSSIVMDLINLKKGYSHSGQLSINKGYMAIQIPYLIFERPIQSMSAGFQKDKGYTSNLYSQLGNLKGYTEVEYINLSDIDCTEDERDRLMEILTSGFYI